LGRAAHRPCTAAPLTRSPCKTTQQAQYAVKALHPVVSVCTEAALCLWCGISCAWRASKGAASQTHQPPYVHALYSRGNQPPCMRPQPTRSRASADIAGAKRACAAPPAAAHKLHIDVVAARLARPQQLEKDPAPSPAQNRRPDNVSCFNSVYDTRADSTLRRSAIGGRAPYTCMTPSVNRA